MRRTYDSPTSKHIAVISIIASCIFLNGCEEAMAPDLALVPAKIVAGRDSLPSWSTASAGDTISFSIVTYGNSCTEKGKVRIAVAPETQQVSVSPFDYRRVGVVCRDILRSFDHRSAVTVEEPGLWAVELNGVNAVGNPVTFSRTVEIN